MRCNAVAKAVESARAVTLSLLPPQGITSFVFAFKVRSASIRVVLMLIKTGCQPADVRCVTPNSAPSRQVCSEHHVCIKCVSLLHDPGHAALASSCHATCPAQSQLVAYLLHQLLLHVIVLPRQVLQLLSSFLHGPVGELGAVLASL